MGQENSTAFEMKGTEGMENIGDFIGPIINSLKTDDKVNSDFLKKIIPDEFKDKAEEVKKILDENIDMNKLMENVKREAADFFTEKPTNEEESGKDNGKEPEEESGKDNGKEPEEEPEKEEQNLNNLNRMEEKKSSKKTEESSKRENNLFEPIKEFFEDFSKVNHRELEQKLKERMNSMKIQSAKTMRLQAGHIHPIPVEKLGLNMGLLTEIQQYSEDLKVMDFDYFYGANPSGIVDILEKYYETVTREYNPTPLCHHVVIEATNCGSMQNLYIEIDVYKNGENNSIKVIAF